MKWLNFYHTLFGKLILSFCILVLIPITLIGIFSFQASEKAMEVQILQSHRNTLEQTSKNIGFLVDQIISSINIFNLSSDLEPMLKLKETDRTQQIKTREQVERRMLANSYAFTNFKMDIILIGLNDTIYSQKPTWLQGIDDLKSLKWYNIVLNEPQRFHWITDQQSLLDNEEDTHVVIAAKMLQSQYSTKNYGILLLSIHEDVLYDIYKEVLSEDNAIFLMDSMGMIISHSDRALVGTRFQEEGLLAEMVSKDADSIQKWSKHQLMISKKIPKTDWFIVEYVPKLSIFRDITNLQTYMVLLSVISLLVALVVAVLLSRFISLPIVKLSRKVRSYSMQNRFPDYNVESINEVNMLSTGYERMIDKLDRTIIDLITNQESKREAELIALQTQINPHFLYNTLNSVKCLVWTKKYDRIEPTVNALVHLLEKTIHRSDEWITLEEEIECIRYYVFIQQIRLDTTIELSVEIDPAIRSYKVPKLLLQPIVENAIFHGFHAIDDEFVISVYCKSVGDRIMIEIIDNGTGMEPQILKQVILGLETKTKDHFNGIGVHNVDERLRMNFGAQYGINIQSELGKGTRVTMMLPQKRKTEG